VFDLGWQEFMMVAFVLVIVVGPKDLPKVLRSFTKITGQARQMARDFTRSLSDLAEDDDLKDIKKIVKDAKSGDLDNVANLLETDVKKEMMDSATRMQREAEAAFQQVEEGSRPSNERPPSNERSVKSKAPAKKSAKKLAKKSAKPRKSKAEKTA
jgi:sec-independent protein translocase protein TatB